MEKINKMNTKNVLVSFLAVFAVVLLAANISASGYNITDVEVNNQNLIYSWMPGKVSVDAGDVVKAEVEFVSNVYDKDVTVTVELDGGDVDVSTETSRFDVVPGERVRKTLSLQLPSELKDELMDNLDVRVEIDGDDYRETQVYSLELIIKRSPYSLDVRSIVVPQRIDAGETFPVDVVLENIGYNDLDDLYVTANIEGLGVTQKGYFGDIVALECDENGDYGAFESDAFDLPYGENTLDRRCNSDNTDSVSGRLFLEMPYGVQAGVYTLNLEVENDDTTASDSVQIVVNNDFETTVFKSGNSVWIVNPTNNVVGYRVVPESPASVSESIVFVPAGASKTVDVSPNANGEYDFGVKVFTLKGELVDTVMFSGSTVAEDNTTTNTNPIVILTVVLAIIFIVLLIVLIVLIGKKPEKSGEFGESYY